MVILLSDKSEDQIEEGNIIYDLLCNDPHKPDKIVFFNDNVFIQGDLLTKDQSDELKKYLANIGIELTDEKTILCG